MRKVLVIGMGAGDPEHMTVQGIRALNALDVLFVLRKADEHAELVALRQEIVRRYVSSGGPRVLTVDDPVRGRGPAAVADWRRRRAEVLERLIGSLGEGETGGFLVWGDPSLYDGTLGVLETVLARGEVAFEYSVVPGITSVSALAAAHRVAVNRVGGAVQLTTGRRLAAGLPEGVDDVVVMLDGEQAFMAVDEDVDVLWGAYLGMPDQILLSGRLAEVRDEIARVRREARERKGWMFDTYLLRRRD